MSYQEFYNRTQKAFVESLKVSATPIAGRFYNCTFIKRPVIFLRRREEPFNYVLEWQFFYRERSFDQTISLCKDEFKLTDFCPRNDFAEYMLMNYYYMVYEHPETLSIYYDEKKKKPDYRLSDDEMRLFVIVDTLYLLNLTGSKDIDKDIDKVKRGLEKTCRPKALNKHPFSIVCYGFKNKEQNREHRERVFKTMTAFLEEFEEIRKEFKPRLKRK